MFLTSREVVDYYDRTLIYQMSFLLMYLAALLNRGCARKIKYLNKFLSLSVLFLICAFLIS